MRNIMKRRIARENAFIAAFEASFNANSIEEIVAASREQDEYAVDAYGEALLANFYAHSAEVDDLIKARLKDWTLARLPRVNAAILRLRGRRFDVPAPRRDRNAVQRQRRYGQYRH